MIDTTDTTDREEQIREIVRDELADKDDHPTASRRGVLQSAGILGLGVGAVGGAATQSAEAAGRGERGEEGPWFDVTAYGAVGNGAKDDSAAIQAAIDDAHSSSEGSVVYYPTPPVSYRVDNVLKPKSGTYHIGPHPHTGAKIEAGPKLSASVFRNRDGFTDIAFWGLEIDGSNGWRRQPYSPDMKAMNLQPGETDDGTKNLRIEQCYLHDTRATALGCDSVMNAHYRENIIKNAGTDGQTQGSNGIGIGVGRVTGACPVWIENNWVIDTAEFGIILEQTGGHQRSWGYHITGNVVDDARVGIAGELVQGADCNFNTVHFSDRMDHGILWGSLDSATGPDHVAAFGNRMIGVSGHEPNVAAFEWGEDAAWGVAYGNMVQTGTFTDYVNEGAYCSIGGVGQEAAGEGNPPTEADRWEKVPVSLVENTDDNTIWTLDSRGEWRRVTDE